jgi:hypothetical protein
MYISTYSPASFCMVAGSSVTEKLIQKSSNEARTSSLFSPENKNLYNNEINNFNKKDMPYRD